MSKELHCRDLGMDCDHVVKGETDEDIVKGALEHAASVHADMLASTPPDQMGQMQEMIVSKIKDSSPGSNVAMA